MSNIEEGEGLWNREVRKERATWERSLSTVSQEGLPRKAKGRTRLRERKGRECGDSNWTSLTAPSLAWDAEPLAPSEDR